MIDVWSYLIGLLPAVITGGVLYYMQRAQKKRDRLTEARAKDRVHEARKELDLMLTTAKLAYATATAVKRGKANGEMEEAFRLYAVAMEEFREFERDMLAKIQSQQ